ncbi:hypothetical protein, partial [Microbispora sp. GKU 823]|uniref:hypothetical protein n=1 Tax=Microbispora sp. GKU 823 TaxID=1652100 RepID=UPI001C4E0C34
MGEGSTGFAAGDSAGSGAVVFEWRTVGRAVTVRVGAGRVTSGLAVDRLARGRFEESGDADREAAVGDGTSAGDEPPPVPAEAAGTVPTPPLAPSRT